MVGETFNMNYDPYVLLGVDPLDYGENDDVIYTCSVMANADVTGYVWYIDDVEQTDETETTLSIDDLTTDYNGKVVKCRVTTGETAATAEVEISFNYSPRITAITDDTFVNTGDTLTLSCFADGNPTPDIAWYREGETEELAHGTDVILTDIGYEDHGIYECVATDPDGYYFSVEKDVLVKGPPEILISHDVLYTVMGHTATLYCIAFSQTPILTMNWVWRGGSITSGSWMRYTAIWEEVELSESISLTITDVSEGDFGYYNCSVTNRYGSGSKRTLLKEQDAGELPLQAVIASCVVGVLVIILLLIISCTVIFYLRRNRGVMDHVPSYLVNIEMPSWAHETGYRAVIPIQIRYDQLYYTRGYEADVRPLRG